MIGTHHQIKGVPFFFFFLCSVVLLMEGGVAAVSISWHLNRIHLSDLQEPLVVANATDFQLLNSDVLSSSLSVNLSALAVLASTPPLQPSAVVRVSIQHTVFRNESQLWLVGGSEDITFDIYVENCTFTDSIFSVLNVLWSRGSRVRFYGNTHTRTAAMGGAAQLLYRTGASWETAMPSLSLLFLQHNLTLRQGSTFDIEGGIMNLSPPSGSSIAFLTTGSTTVSRQSRYQFTRFGVEVIALSSMDKTLAGFVTSDSPTTVDGQSSFRLESIQVSVDGSAAAAAPSAALAALEWNTASTITVKGESTYLIGNSSIQTVSGGENAFGISWIGDSTFSVMSQSALLLNRLNISVQLPVSSSGMALGLYWYGPAATNVISNSSLFSLAQSAVSVSGGLYTYGLLWQVSTNVQQSTWNMSSTYINVSGTSYAYGMMWNDVSSLLTDYSSHIIERVVVEVESFGGIASGMYWKGGSSILAASNFSNFLLRDCRMNVSGTGSTSGLLHYSTRLLLEGYATYLFSRNEIDVTSFSSNSQAMGLRTMTLTIESASTLAIDACRFSAAAPGASLAIGIQWGAQPTLGKEATLQLLHNSFNGDINQDVLDGLAIVAQSDSLGLFIVSNALQVPVTFGIGLSGVKISSRCNTKYGLLLSSQSDPCTLPPASSACSSGTTQLSMECHPQFADQLQYDVSSNPTRCGCLCKSSTLLATLPGPPYPTVDGSDWLAGRVHPDTQCFPTRPTSSSWNEVRPTTPSMSHSRAITTPFIRSTSMTQTETRVGVLQTATAAHVVTVSYESTKTVHANQINPSRSQTFGNRYVSSSVTKEEEVREEISSTRPEEEKISATRQEEEDRTSLDSAGKSGAVSKTIARVFGSETAATATVSVATGSVILSALVGSPARAAQVVRLAALAGALDCHPVPASSSDDSSGDEDSSQVVFVPSLFEYPLQVSLGDGPLRIYVGSTLVSTLLFIVLPWSLTLVVWFTHRALPVDGINATLFKLQAKVLSSLACMCLSYIGPVVLKSFVLVLGHSFTSLGAIVVCCCTQVVLAVAACAVWAVIFGVEKQEGSDPTQGQGSSSTSPSSSSSSPSSNGQPPSAKPPARTSSIFRATFGALFEATRDQRVRLVRSYYLVEVGLTSLLLLFDGIRPSNGNCVGVSVAMAIGCFALLIYCCVARPYRSKLELMFSTMIASLLMVLGVFAFLGNVLERTPSGEPRGWTVKVFGILAFSENILFFVSALTLAIWGYTRAQRRVVLRRQREADAAAAAATGRGPRRATASSTGISDSTAASSSTDGLCNPLLGDVPLLVIGDNQPPPCAIGTSTPTTPSSTGDSLANPLLHP